MVIMLLTLVLTFWRLQSIGRCLLGPGVKVRVFGRLACVLFGLLPVWREGTLAVLELVWLVLGVLLFLCLLLLLLDSLNSFIWEGLLVVICLLLVVVLSIW